MIYFCRKADDQPIDSPDNIRIVADSPQAAAIKFYNAWIKPDHMPIKIMVANGRHTHYSIIELRQVTIASVLSEG
jgi:hypothetical protein